MNTKAEAIRSVADKIARDLFTAYSGTSKPVHCDQMWLYLGEREVAGWQEKPMADRIEQHLRCLFLGEPF